MKRTATLLVILAAGACSRAPASETGELRVIPLGGDVRVLQDGESSALEEATTFESGVSLVTGLDGRAQVELPSGSSVELAPQAEISVNGDEPHIATGSALIRTSSDITVRAGTGDDAEISAADAIFRVDSDISVKLAVYRGAATVLGSGVPAIRGLEQVTIVQGSDIYRSPTPLEVRPNDPWDAQILGDAIDLGLRLVGLEKGLTRQLPAGREAEAVSRTLERDFSPSAIKSALAQLRDAARVVVAAVLAEEVERIDGRSRNRILADVVHLQELGANWIVIVAKWGLAQAAAQVLATLGDIAATIAEAVAPPPAPSPASASAGTGGSTGGESGGTDPGGPGPGGTDPPDSPGPGNRNGGQRPPPPPPDEQPNDEPDAQQCGNEVECAVDDIIGDPPR